MSPEPLELDEYFPGYVPALVADLWKLVLERAFHIEVHRERGRLNAHGRFELRSRATAVGSAQEAASAWRLYVEPDLQAAVDDIARLSNQTVSENVFRDFVSAWTKFFDRYFANEVMPWIERARTKASGDETLTGRGTRVRARQMKLMEVAAFAGSASRREHLISEYLDQFGAYSAHPELFHHPFPREDRGLLTAELRLAGRHLGSAAGKVSAAVDEPGDSSLLAIAEDDNHYKYEACFYARQLLLAVGRWLCAVGSLPNPDAIFEHRLESVRVMVTDPEWSSAEVATSISSWTRDTGGQPHASEPIQGDPVVAGEGEGRAWRIGGDGTPLDPLVLLSESLGSTHAGSLMPFAQGLLARFGTPTSHCALIGRELGIPVIVIGDSIDRLRDGVYLKLTAEGIVRSGEDTRSI